MHEKPLLVFLNNKGLDLPGGLTVEKAERHLRLREKQVVDWSGSGLNAWLMGRHSRVGAHSPVKWLSEHLMEHVWSFVGVLQYTVLVDLRPSQPWRVQPCSVFIETSQERRGRPRRRAPHRQDMGAGEGLAEGLRWLVPLLNEAPGSAGNGVEFWPGDKDAPFPF